MKRLLLTVLVFGLCFAIGFYLAGRGMDETFRDMGWEG